MCLRTYSVNYNDSLAIRESTTLSTSHACVGDYDAITSTCTKKMIVLIQLISKEFSLPIM